MEAGTAAAAPRLATRGAFAGRLTRRGLVTWFLVGLAAIGLAGVVASVVAKLDQTPVCSGDELCASPPTLSAPLVNLTVWRSPALGFSFEYPRAAWRVASHSAQDVTLQNRLTGLNLEVLGAPASMATPQQLLSQKAAAMGHAFSIQRDTDPAVQVLGPTVGFVPGFAATYLAYTKTPQGVGAPYMSFLMAAGDGQVSVAAAATTEAAKMKQLIQYELPDADAVLNSLRFPSGASP